MSTEFIRRQEPAGIRPPDISGTIAVAACGICSSVLVAGALSLLELKTGFGLYYLLFWYVIPAGAAISGFLAAGGYYFGAKIFHHRPGIGSFTWVIAISIMTFFLVNFLNYSFLQFEDGEYVSEYFSFFEYLHNEITNLQYGRRGSSTGKLGLMGYGVTVLQIVGFSGGGWAICHILRNLPFCDGCRRYFKQLKKIGFKTKDYEALKLHSDSLKTLIEEKKFDDAVLLQGAFQAKCKFKPEFSGELKLLECPVCRERRISFEAKKRAGKNWEPLPDLACAGTIKSETAEIVV